MFRGDPVHHQLLPRLAGTSVPRRSCPSPVVASSRRYKCSEEILSITSCCLVSQVQVFRGDPVHQQLSRRLAGTSVPRRSCPSLRCCPSTTPSSTGRRTRSSTPTRQGRTSSCPAATTSPCSMSTTRSTFIIAASFCRASSVAVNCRLTCFHTVVMKLPPTPRSTTPASTGVILMSCSIIIIGTNN